MNTNIKMVIIIFALILVVLIITYMTPLGIKIGYYINGGKKQKTTNETDTYKEELLRDYEKYKYNYELYKESLNPTSKKWSINFMIKANEIAEKFNKISTDIKLDKIGE